MWECKGCHQTVKDSQYLNYQYNVLDKTFLNDSDGSVWLVCGNCKQRGHATCVYSKNLDKVFKLNRYTCCHSEQLHRILYKLNKCFYYGNKVKESDGSNDEN